MNEFRDVIQLRIRETHESLAKARDEQDDYLVELRLGELAGLSHIAAEHGVEVPLP